MEVNTLPKAAAAILGDIRRLTNMVVEQLQDPALFGDPALESSIEHILDRFCLSVQLAKPVGLSTWAVREGRRLGSQRTSELTDAVAHVVATEAGRFGVDQGRLLALLEVLKTEIRSALSAVSDDRGESQSAYTETAQALLCHARRTRFADVLPFEGYRRMGAPHMHGTGIRRRDERFRRDSAPSCTTSARSRLRNRFC